MAIDRQSLVDNVNKGSGLPAQWFAHPGAAGSPQPESYPDLGVKHDPEQAKAVLDEYLAEKGLTADQLDLTLMFNTSESHKRRAEAIQQMWKDALGVNATDEPGVGGLSAATPGRPDNIYRGAGTGLSGCQQLTADVLARRWLCRCSGLGRPRVR
jgi:oligopeptide transport system substrate-binding protein